MTVFCVYYRSKPTKPWESCYLVAGSREKAVASARQILEQEQVLGGKGQVGVAEEGSERIAVIRK